MSARVHLATLGRAIAGRRRRRPTVNTDLQTWKECARKGDSPPVERKVRPHGHASRAIAVLTTAVETWRRTWTPRATSRTFSLFRRPRWTRVDRQSLLVSGRSAVRIRSPAPRSTKVLRRCATDVVERMSGRRSSMPSWLGNRPGRVRSDRPMGHIHPPDQRGIHPANPQAGGLTDLTGAELPAACSMTPTVTGDRSVSFLVSLG